MVNGHARAAGAARRRCWAILLVVAVLASGLGAPRIAEHGSTHPPDQDALRSPYSETGASAAVSPTVVAQAQESSNLLGLSSTGVGSVVRTIFPGYNTSLPGSFTSSVLAWEVGIPTFVPSTNSIWFPQRSVSIPGIPYPTIAPAAVFNLTSKSFDHLVTNLSNSSAVAYDTDNGFLYATEPATDSVAVINPVTEAIVKASIPVGLDPDAIAVDPSSHNVFVANYGSGNVTVIDALDNQVSVPDVAVGSEPVFLVDDSQDGLIFAANAANSFISVITAANPASLQPSIPLFDGPASGLAFSARTDNLLVTISSSIYATLINAEAKAVLSALLPVGKGFGPAATSENGTEFVVGNASGGNVVILNSSVGTQIGSGIAVYRNATQLVLDPTSRTVDCWTSGSRILEAVNLSLNSASAVAPTTSPPLLSITSPIGESRIFAAAGNESLVYPLDTLTLARASPGNITSSPALSIVSDSSSNRLYVGTLSGLKVFNSATDQTVGSVPSLSGEDSQLLLDESDNLLWLVDSSSGVCAVNLATDLVQFSTGLLPPVTAREGIAVDSSNSETFVLVSSSTIAVLNSFTGHVIDPSIVVGSNVTSIVYDPTDQQVYAAGDQVSLLDAITLSLDGAPVVLGSPHEVLAEVYEPSRQAVYISSVGLLEDEQGTISVLNGMSVSGSESSLTEIQVGETPDAFGVVTSGVEPVTGSTMVWVANKLSGTISVITSPPEITSFAASPSTIDFGYPTSISVAYQGGAGVSEITYHGLPPGCSSSNVLQLNCTPTAAGVFSLSANVTDSFGFSANVSTNLTVLRSLTAHTSFSPSTFPNLDPGIPLVATITASNGMPPYAYELSFGDGATASSAGASHAYARPGIYVVTAEVKDATGASNNASSAVVVVSPPSIAVSVSPGTVTDVDIPVQLAAVVTGGTGEAQESWNFGDGTSLDQLNSTHTWTRPGNFSVTFDYTDTLGVKANRTVNVSVDSSLRATFSAGSPSTVNASSPATPVPFTSTASGGTPPYIVSWSFGDGSFSTGQSVSHSYASAGAFSVGATLTDAVGAIVRANLSVTVSQNTGTNSGLPSLTGNFGSGLFLGLLVGGVLAATVLAVAGSRKPPRSPSGPVSPYVPP